MLRIRYWNISRDISREDAARACTHDRRAVLNLIRRSIWKRNILKQNVSRGPAGVVHELENGIGLPGGRSRAGPEAVVSRGYGLPTAGLSKRANLRRQKTRPSTPAPPSRGRSGGSGGHTTAAQPTTARERWSTTRWRRWYTNQGQPGPDKSGGSRSLIGRPGQRDQACPEGKMPLQHNRREGTTKPARHGNRCWGLKWSTPVAGTRARCEGVTVENPLKRPAMYMSDEDTCVAMNPFPIIGIELDATPASVGE